MKREFSRRRFLGAGTAAAAGILCRGAVAGAAASLFSGCTERRPAEELARRLTFALIRDIRTLDPCYMEMAVDSYIISNIHETLTWYDRNLQMQPRLATSWEAQENGKIWIFNLRKGVKFHDGTDFNSEAVKFHFDRVKNPANASTRQARVEFMEGVDAIDEHTVRFRMTKPFSVWPDVIRGAFAAVISPAAARHLKNPKDYTQHPVGTGPYKFVKYVPNNYLLLERNENYWNRDVIHIPEILFKPIKENTTRLILLEQGNIDIADVFFTHVHIAREGGRFEVQSIPELRVRYVGFNTQKPPFDDPRVRRACNHAINRETIAKHAFRGHVVPSYGPLPAAHPAYNHEMQVYHYDPKRARELLTEAGYPNGIDAVFWAMDTGEDRILLEAVTAQLREIGVRTTVYQYDRAVYWDKFNAFQTPDGKIFPRNPGVYDLFVAGWSGGESAFGFLDPLFRAGSFSNSCFYENKQVDGLLHEVLAVTDPVARDGVYKKLQQVIVDDAPWIFSYCTHNIVGNLPRVEGWTASPAGEYEFQNVRLSTRADTT